MIIGYQKLILIIESHNILDSGHIPAEGLYKEQK